jgi:hypothetical protein
MQRAEMRGHQLENLAVELRRLSQPPGAMQIDRRRESPFPGLTRFCPDGACGCFTMRCLCLTVSPEHGLIVPTILRALACESTTECTPMQPEPARASAPADIRERILIRWQ